LETKLRVCRKNCAIFDDSVTQKWDFMNPSWEGGNTPRKWENSAKNRKVGMSAIQLHNSIHTQCMHGTEHKLSTKRCVRTTWATICSLSSLETGWDVSEQRRWGCSADAVLKGDVASAAVSGNEVRCGWGSLGQGR